jgi:transposase
VYIGYPLCLRRKRPGNAHFHLFVFRGRKANLIKIVFWDGKGLCLFTSWLKHGVLMWPANIEQGRTLSLRSEQLSHLLEGIDWRTLERHWRLALAGQVCGRMAHRTFGSRHLGHLVPGGVYFGQGR